MTAKQYLKQAYKLNEIIQDKKDRIKFLDDMSGCISSFDYSREPVQSGIVSSDGAFVPRILEKMQLEQELISDIEKLQKLYVEISQAIDKVPDTNQRLVLSKRYLLMKKWEVIADEIHYSVMQTHRIHIDGLEAFNDVMECDIKMV